MAERKFEYLPILVIEKIPVSEFLEKQQPSVKPEKKWTPAQFLTEFKDETQSNFPNNLEAIWSHYDEREKVEYKEDYDAQNPPFIKPGTEVLVKVDGFQYSTTERPNIDKFVQTSDFQAYWDTRYMQLIADPTFIVADQLISSEMAEVGVSVKNMRVNCRVYIYCNAIDMVFDITSFVSSITTGKSRKKGTFNVVVTPSYDATVMNLGGATLEQFGQLGNGKYQMKSLLERFVQANDSVFIRYERLSIEGEDEASFDTEYNIEIPKNKVSAGYWDMIGFVDSCRVSFDAAQQQTTIEISGRDFSKFFEDDGSYFLPLQMADGSEDLNWIAGGKSTILKRNVISGEYDYLWTYDFKHIKDMIWWIINVMSTVKATSGSFYDGWQLTRSAGQAIEGQESFPVEGVWKILQVAIDPQLNEYVSADSSIGNPNGTMMEYMDRFCQYPFVEFFFDTYKSNINLTVRKPPTNKDAIKGAYAAQNYIKIDSSTILSQSLSYDDRYYSWYEVNLTNSWLGKARSINRAFIPIVYLDQYAKMWGNRKLQTSCIYFHLQDTSGPASQEQIGAFTAGCIRELCYLLESNAYLPFTRKGTITMVGDRRIKVGTFVLNEFSNEFFLVTGVTNSVQFSSDSIQRTTVLNVERGMYVPILGGLSIEAQQEARQDHSKGMASAADYFNIVKLDNLKALAAKAAAGELVSWENEIMVNDGVFQALLTRRMYVGSGSSV